MTTIQPASIEQLIELNMGGDLGSLLERTFKGTLGHLSPRKDADFIIAFASAEDAPKPPAIQEAVEGHYSALGYMIKPQICGQPVQQFAAIVYPEQIGESVSIIITTEYPNKGSRPWARVTTTLHI